MDHLVRDDEDNDEDNPYLCTFAISMSNGIQQEIYCCLTCGYDQLKLCCCAGCVETCHSGHEVEFVAFSEGFCDCGSQSCSLLAQTIEKYPQCSCCNITSSNEPCPPIESLISPFSAHYLDSSSTSSCDISSYLNRLQDDCISLVEQSKDTFWIDSTVKCKCVLEEFAIQIYNLHIADINRKIKESGFDYEINETNSGAEWWVQVKDISSSTFDNQKTAIDLHYDKDEEVAELFNIGKFPLLSTVTYLTDLPYIVRGDSDVVYPSPTLILPHKCMDEIDAPINECYVSYPVKGKHVSFDGRLLHGAPSSDALKKSSSNVLSHDLALQDMDDNISNSVPASSNIRITLLVNLWVNHKPFNLTSLPTEIALKLPSASLYRDTASIDQIFTLKDYDNKLSTIVVDAYGNDRIVIDNENELSSNKVSHEENGVVECVTLPFITADSTWEKHQDDDEMTLQLYVPQSMRVLSSGRNKSDCYFIRYDSDVYSARLITSEEDAEEGDYASDEYKDDRS